MNEQVINAMLALIRHVVCGAELTEEEKVGITPALLPQLYKLSKAHDMAHIVSRGLSDLGFLGEDEVSAKFQKQQMLSVYRYQQLNYELERIRRTLEEAEIPFLPLKGSVIRKYYPEPWMRTSCDIDVLVHEEDLEKAVDALVEALGYKNEGKSSHDVTLVAENGIHIELHYDLIEEVRYPNVVKLLSRVWEYAEPMNGAGYWHRLKDEMFYLYHCAHMAKHFENGGCGIRPFTDLWILDNRIPNDQTVRDQLLEQGGLLPLAIACRNLSKVWFDHAEHDKTTEKMQDYILFGGVYGTLDNRVAVQQNKKGGKVQYALSRIFLKYDVIKFHYPILQKHRWLTPIMEVRRWFKLLFKGHVKSSLRELSINQSMSQEKITQTAELLSELGLK